jgi:hypothetical protein
MSISVHLKERKARPARALVVEAYALRQILLATHEVR